MGGRDDGVQPVRAFGYANTGQYSALRAMLEEQAERVSKGSGGLLGALWSEMDDHDKEVADDIALRRIIADIHVEALSNNCVDGWTDDVIALSGPWGFEPAKITCACQTLGWEKRRLLASWSYVLAGGADQRRRGRDRVRESPFRRGRDSPQDPRLDRARKANAERSSELVVSEGSRRARPLSAGRSPARVRWR